MDSFQLYPEIIDMEQIESANSPISIIKKPGEKSGKKLKVPEKCGLCGLDLSKESKKSIAIDFIRHLYRKHQQIKEKFQQEYGNFDGKSNDKFIYSCPFENCSYVDKKSKFHVMEHIFGQHDVAQRYYDEEIILNQQKNHSSVELKSSSYFEDITVQEKRKPYNCETCGKSFSTGGNVKKHIRNVHHEDQKHFKSVKTVQEKCKPYNCETCGKTFSTGGNVKKHIRNVHHEDQKHFKSVKTDSLKKFNDPEENFKIKISGQPITPKLDNLPMENKATADR